MTPRRQNKEGCEKAGARPLGSAVTRAAGQAAVAHWQPHKSQGLKNQGLGPARFEIYLH